MFSTAISSIRRWNRTRLAARKALRLSRPAVLGVLAIMKNESMNIDEWIEHYLWMGATTIYLIDNGSTDDTVRKARAWEAGGRVKLVEYSGKHKQERHYWNAIKHFGIRRDCEWLLVADLDEFWFCPNGDTLATALSEFHSYDVIYSNWVMFGSGGLVKHPPSVREGFVLRAPGTAGHDVKKHICRPRVLKRAASLRIHEVRGASSARTVSDVQRFQLNHYPIQSEEFFRLVKMTRGDVNNARSDGVRDMGYFSRHNDGCIEVDRKLADLVAASRNR